MCRIRLRESRNLCNPNKSFMVFFTDSLCTVFYRVQAELSFLLTFLAVLHHVVIVGRKIIDGTAISFPKINCLARSSVAPS